MPAEDPRSARHVKLEIAYDGTDFHGWQAQSGCRTVEGVLEAVLEGLEGAPVDVTGASRTDKGVHALGQAACFPSRTRIPPERYRDALNGRLPADVRVTRSEQVDESFHARHSAVGKCYRYLIDRQLVPNVLQSRYALHVEGRLDLDQMREAALHFVGEKDFAAFQCESGQAPATTVRRVDAVLFFERGPYLSTEVWGRSFLYKMVRTMVGTLLEVGRGKWPPGRVAEAIQSLDRSRSGPTAPAHGLTLVSVHYDDEAWRRSVAARVDGDFDPGYHAVTI